MTDIDDGFGDQLDRTARQLRLDYPEAVIHRLRSDWIDPWSGALYDTRCRETLSKQEGAILTTRTATCHYCVTGERRPNR